MVSTCCGRDPFWDNYHSCIFTDRIQVTMTTTPKYGTRNLLQAELVL